MLLTMKAVPLDHSHPGNAVWFDGRRWHYQRQGVIDPRPLDAAPPGYLGALLRGVELDPLPSLTDYKNREETEPTRPNDASVSA
jgi:hypothetical protein